MINETGILKIKINKKQNKKSFRLNFFFFFLLILLKKNQL